MPRTPRVVVPGLPHHITQRSVARTDIFITDQIRRVYLDLLAEHAERNRIRILGFCLMTNHVHVVAVPPSDRALANLFRHTHSRFSQYWNTLNQRVGHLWQNRYYSCAIEEHRAWRVIQYVESNPVRTGMTIAARDWPWSSAGAHLGDGDCFGLLDLAWWFNLWSPPEWEEVVGGRGIDDEELEAIRKATYSGRPIGSPEFVAQLEVALGRPLAARKGGRPPKAPLEVVAGGRVEKVVNVSSVPGFRGTLRRAESG